MTHDLAASGLRFGIEEEFFLLDASDLDIVRSAPAGFVAACRDTLGEHFAEEMFECQVEVASPVFSTLAEAARFHGQARQRLAHLAMEFGLRSLCVGTHPFADWRRARSNPAAHFARLFEDQGRVARRSLVCGLHMHVEIPPSHDRMAVLQRVLPWLPLLLALSASSPFRGGRRSGLASYRRALCGEWPRMNIPPALPDEDAYRRHLALLREAGCIREDGQVWWMIRPSSHVPTLELRICDACPRLADALSLAGLFRALVGEALGADPRALPVARDACLEENYWQALRCGCAGRYLVGGRAVGAGDWLEMAWRQCRPQARQGNEWAYQHARGLLGDLRQSPVAALPDIARSGPGTVCGAAPAGGRTAGGESPAGLGRSGRQARPRRRPVIPSGRWSADANPRSGVGRTSQGFATMSFSRFAQRLSNWSGRPPTFVIALGLILAWAISGPFFDFNDTWQLVINTSTTIVTFLMVFLIQNTQNRDTDALHIKIDELLRSTRRAHNALLGLDDLDADTLRELRERYQRMGERDGDTPQGVASEEARECACEERQRDA